MKWLKRRSSWRELPKAAPDEPDGMTPGPYAAYWWRPGCTCHFMAGIESEYCAFCLANEADGGDPS